MADKKKSLKKQAHPGTGKRLLSYIFSHYKASLLLVFICIIITAVSSVIANVFMKQIIDDCITPALKNGFPSVWDKFIRIILTMMIIYLFGVVANFIYTRKMANVTQGTLMNLRNDMFEKMQTLPIKYFDTHPHGDIMSTYTNDTDAIRQVIGQSGPMVFQSALSIISVFIMMLSYSVWLTIIVVAVVFLMVKIIGDLGGKSSKYMIAQQKSLAREEGFIEEIMSGQKVVKVFNHEARAEEDFDQLNEKLFSDSEKANRFGNILMPTLGNVGNLMYVVIAFIGVMLAHYEIFNLSLSGNGKITVGIVIVFLSSARQLSQTVGQVSMQIPLIAMGIAGAARVFDLMDQEPEVDEGLVRLVNVTKKADGSLSPTEKKTDLWAWKGPNQDGSFTLTELKGDIRMQDVDFGYNEDKIVLHDVTLYAKPGQKIAFVGATGAGKTTITNLINRFYDVADGKIRYDGININKIKKSDLRRSLGIVLQEVNLFTGTVMENIRYGRLDATDEECIAAAKLANADDFITRLPDGYDTMLTANGSSLSQGQRQLISIARAAVADPPVMILDEATSSIDTRTEALVSEGMDNLMEGRTVFVIAHRLSTVRNSKAIMVLDHGNIIERGDHDSLIADKGIYYQLYTGAFELD